MPENEQTKQDGTARGIGGTESSDLLHNYKPPCRKSILTYDTGGVQLFEEMGGPVEEVQIRLLNDKGFFVPLSGLLINKVLSTKADYLPVFKVTLIGQRSQS